MHPRLRTILVLLALSAGCHSEGGSFEIPAEEPTTSWTNPTTTGSSTDPSPTGTTTGLTTSGTTSVGHWDGTYDGHIYVDLTEIWGFGWTFYSYCDAPITLTVVEAAYPQITGTTSCYPTGSVGTTAGTTAARQFNIQIEGDISVEPAAEGVVELDWWDGKGAYTGQDWWTGSYLDDDTLEGTFLGGTSSHGYVSDGLFWQATFTVSR